MLLSYVFAAHSERVKRDLQNDIAYKNNNTWNIFIVENITGQLEFLLGVTPYRHEYESLDMVSVCYMKICKSL